MKKTGMFLALVSGACTAYHAPDVAPIWTGFYLGANVGGLWSASNVVRNVAFPTYANLNVAPNFNTAVSAVEPIGNQVLDTSLSSFIGGGQLGYNTPFLDNWILGIDADLDALSKTNDSAQKNKTVTTAQIGTYDAQITVTKKLTYLGLLKGRLGFLLNPTLMVYGAGGFAYGGAGLTTTYSVTPSSQFFLPFNALGNHSKMLAGWVAGGGAEWAFSTSWSVKLECLYYNLGPLRNTVTLTQALSTNPPLPYVQATIFSNSRVSENTLRVGLNYHFA